MPIPMIPAPLQMPRRNTKKLPELEPKARAPVVLSSDPLERIRMTKKTLTNPHTIVSTSRKQSAVLASLDETEDPRGLMGALRPLKRPKPTHGNKNRKKPTSSHGAFDLFW